jgi:diguanylate cyclase (GGDEF)-like protein
MSGNLWRHFLRIFLPISLLVGVILSLFFVQSSNSDQMAALAFKNSLVLKNRDILEQVHHSTTQLFQHKIDDLMVLSESEPLRLYLRDDSMKNWIHLARWFETFSKHKKYFDQIRFIDDQGSEQMRVNYNGGTPAIVPRTHLHNIYGQSYFQQAIKLERREIYISPLDLTVEKDQAEIQHKPAIRFATPVYDGYAKKRGVFIIDYSALELQDNINQIAPKENSQVVVLNRNGLEIMGSGLSEKEWRARFRQETTFPAEFPTAWKTIADSPEGHINGEHHSLIYTTIYPIKDALNKLPGEQNGEFLPITSHQSDSMQWKLIATLPHKGAGLSHSRSTSYSVISLLMLLIVGSISFFYAKISLRRQQSLAAMQALVNTDTLTGIASRYLFTTNSEIEFARAKRYGRDFTVMMLDVDHFKMINDTHGHPVGDEVLKEIASICNQILRKPDLMARWGGEEFAFLLPESDLDGSRQLAERICKQVATNPISTTAGEVEVTVSIGVSGLSRDDRKFSDLLNRADEALYAAKEQGRNRVVVR